MLQVDESGVRHGLQGLLVFPLPGEGVRVAPVLHRAPAAMPRPAIFSGRVAGRPCWRISRWPAQGRPAQLDQGFEAPARLEAVEPRGDGVPVGVEDGLQLWLMVWPNALSRMAWALAEGEVGGPQKTLASCSLASSETLFTNLKRDMAAKRLQS